MIGVGDIGVCGASGDEATAALVDSVLIADSVQKLETVVFTLGFLCVVGIFWQVIS